MTDKDTKVQFGPVYRCWVCGAVVPRVVPWTEWVPGRTLLDEVADHIGYLDLPAACREAHHPSRVAVVGPAITLLDWPAQATVPEKVAAVRTAIALLATELEKQQGEPSGIDQALSLALRLYAQATPPAQGAQEIRNLAGRAAFAGV